LRQLGHLQKNTANATMVHYYIDQRGDPDMFNIEEELKKIPHRPGVYLMHEGDLILYVGKARDLHNRVRQYFPTPKGRSPWIYQMVERIEYFEYIVTDTEMEALILENNLIKKHKPPYNTLLKDDKQYPYLKVTMQEAYPRVIKTRKISRDKARYFGPYTNVGAVNQTLELMEKLWPLKTCNRNLPKDIGKERPCLNYYIGKCCGPCTGKVTPEEYRQLVDQALTLLSGRHNEVINNLKAKMLDASSKLEFEKAARYRDQIESVQFLSQSQKIENAGSDQDRDVIGIAQKGEGEKNSDSALVQVFFMRGGKLIGREHFMMESAGSVDPGVIIGYFIQQFYGGTAFIPKEIDVQKLPPDADLLEEFLSSKLGSKVQISKPVRGDRAKLVGLAVSNAQIQMKQFGERLEAEEKRTKGAMQQLADLLGFDEYPLNRIEAYDISNTFGSLSVGSMVVFEDGKPKNSDYRKFRIKTVVGSDDYASMREVLTRRFTHALTEIRQMAKEGKDPSFGSFTKLPDLVLMDGGRGQVNIAEDVLSQVGLDIPVAGMVKDDRHNTRGLYYHNKEIDFGKNRAAFLLITRIQDEAHRFAITYHRSLRAKEQVRSMLESIPNIGPARRKALLTAFASIDAIKKAELADLEAVDGMNKRSAESVYNFFRQEKALDAEGVAGAEDEGAAADADRG